jgi:hypothetical protein
MQVYTMVHFQDGEAQTFPVVDQWCSSWVRFGQVWDLSWIPSPSRRGCKWIARWRHRVFHGSWDVEGALHQGLGQFGQECESSPHLGHHAKGLPWDPWA